MSARANTLSPLLVAYSSLRKLMTEAQIPLQTAPSSRTVPPSLERFLLTFLAAVCALHPDCDEAAVAVARANTSSTDTTLYIATAIKASPALQGAFGRFVGDLRAAYRHKPDVDHVLSAMYRFTYPLLHQCLWDDPRLQQVSGYLENRGSHSILQALEELKNVTKENNAEAIAADVLKNMHKPCCTIHAFLREGVESVPKGGLGSVADDFLTDITSAFVVASYFDPIISGTCLSDDRVGSLMEGTRAWTIRWIDPPTPAVFEAELSTSAVTTWLDEYSQSSTFHPWGAAIAEIASCCPAHLTKTGSSYTSGEPTSIHCEITLLLWLVQQNVPVDMHIGCSGYACWLCVKFAQALGRANPHYDVALSDVLDQSTTIDLPWICSADAPDDKVIETLRIILLKDFRRDALTYVSHDFEPDTLGLEGVPESFLTVKS